MSDRPSPLSPAEIAVRLAILPPWRREDDALARDYRFASFDDAMAFFQRAAADVRRLDHHPRWSNSYRRVSVRLTTHRTAEGRGITALDFELATALERVARAIGTER